MGAIGISAKYKSLCYTLKDLGLTSLALGLFMVRISKAVIYEWDGNRRVVLAILTNLEIPIIKHIFTMMYMYVGIFVMSSKLTASFVNLK